MPDIILIAGPNGAGKTTFARNYLASEHASYPFINADEIERSITDPALSRTQRDLQAARAMLERIEALVGANADFVVETTLASLSYAAKIPGWRQTGYRIHLIYLRLPDAEASIARVARRVAAGGHSIPEDVIRRRFAKSLDYLENRYKRAVDEWYIWDSLEGTFSLAESWND